MEGKGRRADWISVALHRGPDPAGDRTTALAHTLASGNFHEEWHRFALEWAPEQIRWYVDDTRIQTVDKPSGEDPVYWPFDHGHPFFIIFNLAVGGWFDRPHLPPKGMEPQRLYVDFIRVYRLAEGH